MAEGPTLEQVVQALSAAVESVESTKLAPQARTDLVLATVRSLLQTVRSAPQGHPDERLDREHDLYALAQTVAAMTGGLVSIEDERAHLLAYSATDGAADDLRMMSILGREGPADYLRRLREWGVYDKLRRQPGVVEVPADPELHWRRRLAVDIRPLGWEPAAGEGERSLGTIWLQEGTRPLEPEAGSVLTGAAVVAARLIGRVRNAPTQEALAIQRLFGLRDGEVHIPSLAASLSLPLDGPTAVIGLGLPGGSGTPWPASMSITELSATVRLHASAYAPESLVATGDERIYVLIPRLRASGLTAWVAQMLDRLTARSGIELRAAVAAPVRTLAETSAARVEVDRVLTRPGGARVATLAASRTSVLLGEIADLIARRDELGDPRLGALVADDRARAGSLLGSVEQYLNSFGDVRSAAAKLHIHPNTLRYRIKRAEQALGMNLDDADDRLLLQLQILRWRRARS